MADAIQRFGETRVIADKTATYTVLRSESGKFFTNEGAAGTIKFNLPQDSIKGEWFEFLAAANQDVTVDPGAAGALYGDVDGSSGWTRQADNTHAVLDVQGDCIRVLAKGDGDWYTINQSEVGDITFAA